MFHYFKRDTFQGILNNTYYQKYSIIRLFCCRVGICRNKFKKCRIQWNHSSWLFTVTHS